MDLTSLTNVRSGLPAGAYNNPDVETRVVFDEQTGRPYFVAVPSPTSQLPDRVPQRHVAEQGGPAPTPMTVYQPVQPYYGLPAAPATYSPVRDPIVCRLLAGAVAVGVGALALSFVLSALAAATTALGFLALALALIWLLTSGKGGADKGVNIRINNSNSSRRWR